MRSRLPKMLLAAALALAAAAGCRAGDLTGFAPAEIGLDEEFRLLVNGEPVVTDVSPVVVNRTLMVPVRFVSERLGMEVGWDPDLKRVTIAGQGREAVLTVGSHRVWAGSGWYEMSLAPMIYRGRTMVPYEALNVAELLDRTRPAAAGPLPFERAALAAEAESRPDSGPGDDEARPELLSGLPQSFASFKYVVWTLWVAALLILMARRRFSGRGADAVHWLSLLLILIVYPAAYYGLRSSYFSAAVPLGAAIIGLVSKEDVYNALVTLSNSATQFGLLGTLVGLGPIIGPAIAQKDVQAIGFGLATVIETTILGILIALLANAVGSRLPTPTEVGEP